MSKYITKQRKILAEYLSNHTDESISASQIANALSDKISKSAVYRNLADMEEEGKLRRVANSSCREAVYQYLDDEHCKNCLHLSCKKCGKTYHMQTAVANSLINSVAENENFSIDKGETVLYGVCCDCQLSKVAEEK
ncbi:MAG: transcriptional repressor [Ruminococcus sp.]|nr:transcriptional repressor [Ruminococcus sp.]